MSNNKIGTNTDYLEEQKNQTAATVPTAPTTPKKGDYAEYLKGIQPSTNVGGDSYAAFLRTLENNKKIENTPTNALSYADFLTYYGKDPVGDYLAQRRQADVEYAKAMATYGQTAEKMAKSGLTGSGYGDYLQGVAYRTRQGAVADAQKTAAAEQKTSFANYAEYLSGMGTARDATVEQGRADLANATAAVSGLMSEEGGGMTLDAAIASLNGVYGDDVLAKVKENVAGASLKTLDAAINGTDAPMQDFFGAINQMKDNGFISTDAQYNDMVGRARIANFNAIMRAYESSDFSSIAAYAEAMGLDISGGSKEALNALVDYAAAKGHIEGAAMQEYYFESRKESIEETDYSAPDAKNEVEEIYKLCNNGKITDAQREELIEALGDEFESDSGFGFGGIKWKTDTSATLYYTYKNDNGKTKKGQIDISTVAAKKVEGDFKLLWNGDNGAQIGRIGDQLVMAYNGAYYKAGYGDGSENDIAIAWMLTHGE